MSEAGIDAGGRVVGRYVLYDELASGGMATVHIGRLVGEVGFSRSVAIKRLHPQFAHDPEFVAMFVEEARLAARIRHPNVVPVLDVVSMEDELFLVMEYIQGETLTRLTRVSRSRNRIIPMPIALAIASDMLTGLHAAHEARDENGAPLHIVHRDVSPHNVMVGHDGAARVLDFGIAKASSSAQSTRDGEVRGKFAYMSPEQLSSVPVDRRADVFASSIVLWEMLTGQRLFQANDPAGIVGKLLHGAIQPPGVVAGGLPASLDALVMKGLERDPSRRFGTALEMARAIDDLRLTIARPTEVGTWVDRIAGDTLKRRAQRIAEIESTGSFSRSQALAVTRNLSSAPLPADGSASASRSGLRPREASQPAYAPSAPSYPAPTPSHPAAAPSYPASAPSAPAWPPSGADASQPQPFYDEPAVTPPPARGSGRAIVLVLLVATMVGAVAFFIWRSGGIAGARSRIAQLWASDVAAAPPVVATPPSATPSAVVSSAPTQSTALQGAVIDTTTTDPTAHQRHRARGVNRNVTPDPPDTTEQNAQPVPQATTTQQATAPKPSQAQVQMAIGPLMRTARACLAADDGESRALMTFQSDGSVKSVTVTGFAAGKSQEACIKTAMSRAHVDPFLDSTYTLPVTIRP